MILYNALPFNSAFQNTDNFFYYPYQSGFLDFVIGGFALLSIYHLFLFFQNRNKLYLLYSLYLFFIILSQLHYVHSGFLNSILKSLGTWAQFPEFYTEAYYFIYFLFAFKFLEIKEDFPKWHKYIKRALYVIAVFCVIKLLHGIFTGHYSFYRNGYYVFDLYVVLLSVFMYMLFFRSKRPLKYYLIIGSFILLVFSVLSLLLYFDYIIKGESPEPAYFYLYIGYVLENIVFSLGLGRRQKSILDERNQVQLKLIEQLKENEKLEVEVRKKLQQDVELLQAKVERDKLERLTMQYERDLVELKLASLRSQMNPHFIFNSLNSIKRFIIDNEQENAVFYLNKFSKLVRLILSSSVEKDISLADEIEIAKLYVNIENIRFNNHLHFNVAVDESLALNAIKVPALIFQPFLENAIWHGLTMKEGGKELYFRLHKKGEHLVSEIEDNGIGRERAKAIREKKLMKRESYGMQLTQDRLKNFVGAYGKEYSLDIVDLKNKKGEPQGTLVRITIPIIIPKK